MSGSSMSLSLARGGLCLVAFLAGLGGVGRTIRELLPFPDVMLVKPKIDYFAEHHDDYDTLFLGSSRIYYQVIPALFDRLSAEKGAATKSFNAAIAGMRPPEDAFYLDSLLRHPPRHLRWVFIELSFFRIAVDRDEVGTVRAVYWHDLPRLWLLLKRALEVKPGGKKRIWRKELEVRLTPLGDFVEHLPLFFKNQTNIGRGSILTSRLIYAKLRPPAPFWATLGEDLAGWIPTGRPETMSDAEQQEYEKVLAARRAQPPRRDVGDPVSQEALELMLSKIEKLGATPVLIVPPTTNKRNFYPSPERAKKTIVLDFCDPEKFPVLYESRYRLDTDHLNAEGSKIFTELIVKEWAERMKRRQ